MGRARMFASRRSMSPVWNPTLATDLLEFLHEFVLSGSRRSDQFLHFFAGEAKGLKVGLARFGPGRNVDTDRRAMTHDRDWLFRLEIAGQVFPELTNSDLCGLHRITSLCTQ